MGTVETTVWVQLAAGLCCRPRPGTATLPSSCSWEIHCSYDCLTGVWCEQFQNSLSSFFETEGVPIQVSL